MKIAMLISGGVDSSVALRLLRDAGHDITAFYLKIWLEDELSFLGECPWEEDVSYAGAVCREAGVPFEVVPFQKEYWERIVAYVIDEARSGRTPNPDVFCNTRIKFGAFLDRFGDDFDRVATGHYAQVECGDAVVGGKSCHSREACPRPRSGGGNLDSGSKAGMTKLCFLKKSPDPIKDQTYFLAMLSQAQVSRAVFPIGKYRKDEVRELAREYGLPNAERKDSQGICFLGQVQFDRFLEHHLGTKEGGIVDWKTGKRLGTHRGYWFYTIGQRRGIGLSGGPWYVAAKDVGTNTVFVSNEWRSENMARDSFIVSGLNWISVHLPAISPLRPSERTAPLEEGSGSLTVKLRHGPKEYPCTVGRIGDGNLQVQLGGLDRGIAAGQIAVFYDGEYCLGGGVIMETQDEERSVQNAGLGTGGRHA